jgi:hypothetical protein
MESNRKNEKKLEVLINIFVTLFIGKVAGFDRKTIGTRLRMGKPFCRDSCALLQLIEFVASILFSY